MNLYEWEGKVLFKKFGIPTPKGVNIKKLDEVVEAYGRIGGDVVVKAQILSGKRGKAGGIIKCGSLEQVQQAVAYLFSKNIAGYAVASIRIEEAVEIAEEHYVSITYDTSVRRPVLVYSKAGGVDVESGGELAFTKIELDVRQDKLSALVQDKLRDAFGIAQKLWTCFLESDARVCEINPLAKLVDGQFVALDAKIALDDDAFFRHEEWESYEDRTMMKRPPTEREIAVKKIDEGEGYYRGTAGKYIEMDGDIAVLFSGGGASIANMDVMIQNGLQPANYTEYSGNPPREKVAALAKIVLSKPGLRGLWIAGGVANFTNVAETFQGIIDALDEVKPTYPIVIRRSGPFEAEGMKLMEECAKRNGLSMKLYSKDMSMSETAKILGDMVN